MRGKEHGQQGEMNGKESRSAVAPSTDRLAELVI